MVETYLEPSGCPGTGDSKLVSHRSKDLLVLGVLNKVIRFTDVPRHVEQAAMETPPFVFWGRSRGPPFAGRATPGLHACTDAAGAVGFPELHDLPMRVFV